MKPKFTRIVLSLAAAGFIAGCSKQQNAGQPSTPQQSIQPRKIFGAFGWQLGQTIPSTQEISRGSDGKMVAYIDAKDYPPFTSCALVMAEDRRVCKIVAWSKEAVSPQSADIVLASLTNKYGPIKQHTVDASHENKQTWWIEDGYASIAFDILGDGTIDLIYHDDKLEISTNF